MKNSIYYKQADLLLRTIPIIRGYDEFALKGGTAINFFVRNMPRLSVDIDLAYLPIESREETRKNIDSMISGIKEEIQKRIPNSIVTDRVDRKTKLGYGLLVKVQEVQIKIEINTVIRSSVYKPEVLNLCRNAEDIFELSVEAKCLSLEDLYGGKICATLDRQHPRDLFDIKLLLENEGLTDSIRKAFIVYLISHNRPIVELLNPSFKELEETFDKEFTGMVDQEISLNELKRVREKLVSEIRSSLSKAEIEFILSFKNKNPDWSLLGLGEIEKLPSVQWKLANLNAMDGKKHEIAYKKLNDYLMES